MFIALFDINLNHITNLRNITCELTTKVYDFDDIKLTGEDVYEISIDELNKAKIFRLSEDDGTEVYSGFVYKISKQYNTITIQGNDFRTMLDTEILVDWSLYPTPAGVDELLDIVCYVFNHQPDLVAQSIQYNFTYDVEPTNNYQDIFGEIPKEPMVMNVYKYLLTPLKYYDNRIISWFDWENNVLRFHATGFRLTHKIRLKDFAYDLSQNQPQINKAIAVMRHAAFGYKWVKQELASFWKDVLPLQTQWATSQPTHPDSSYRWYSTGNTRTYREWKYQQYDSVFDQWVDVYDYYDTGIIQWSTNQPTAQPGYRWVWTGRQYKEWKLQRYYSAHIEGPGWHDVTPLQTQWAYMQPSADSGYRWVQTGNLGQKEWKEQRQELVKQWSYTQPVASGNYRWTATGNANPTEYEYKLQQYVTEYVNVEPEEFEWSQTEPEEELEPNQRWFNTGETLPPIGAVKYYYLTSENQIVESDQYGTNVENRIYPVKARIFTDEYLANAQYQAILELANQRYVDNIYLDADSPLNPINLTEIGLFDLVEVYDSNYHKILPVSEKELRVGKDGRKFRLKLGFKKTKITDIIKAVI